MVYKNHLIHISVSYQNKETSCCSAEKLGSVLYIINQLYNVLSSMTLHMREDWTKTSISLDKHTINDWSQLAIETNPR